MAAGMGSRYGGLKQLDPVGPSGEVILEYSVFDAIRAGFDSAVFVIRRDFESEFRARVLSRFHGRCRADVAFQGIDDLPAGFAAPRERKKPWGTTHAVLRAKTLVASPFCVINADDFYGESGFRAAGAFLSAGPTSAERGPSAAMVAYRLANTLSEHGGVTRGVCRVGAGGRLEGIAELGPIARTPGGAEYRPDGASPIPLAGDELVSMNFWAFTPAIFSELETLFEEFLREHLQDPAAEFLLPHAVDALIERRGLDVSVLECDGAWFGVTHGADMPKAREAVAALVRAGAYPSPLWG
jgi:hypothetical protein